jgi:cytochrome c553
MSGYAFTLKENAMRILKLAIPAVIVMSGFLVCTTATYGKPEYQKKENLKSCTACHAKAATKDNPNLNDLGTCYQKGDHSFAKCTVPADLKKS